MGFLVASCLCSSWHKPSLARNLLTFSHAFAISFFLHFLLFSPHPPLTFLPVFFLVYFFFIRFTIYTAFASICTSHTVFIYRWGVVCRFPFVLQLLSMVRRVVRKITYDFEDIFRVIASLFLCKYFIISCCLRNNKKYDKAQNIAAEFAEKTNRSLNSRLFFVLEWDECIVDSTWRNTTFIVALWHFHLRTK